MRVKNIVIALSALYITGCSFNVPSQLSSTARVEVIESVEHKTFETDLLNKKLISEIVNKERVGQHGEVEVVVSYDPESKKNTAMKATLEGKRITQELMAQGVRSVTTKVLPVAGSSNLSKTFIGYKSLAAQAPDGCGRMPGFESKDDIGNQEQHLEYSYGCTVESLLARQIANPADLLGQEDKNATSSGRRAENVVSGRGYYGFEQFPDLGGEQSSE